MHPKMIQASVNSSDISTLIDDPSNNTNQQRITQIDFRNSFYTPRVGQYFPDFSPNLDNLQSLRGSYTDQNPRKIESLKQTPVPSLVNNPIPDWNPRAVLQNLSFLEQKIHQMQGIVHSAINREGQSSVNPNELTAQQQIVKADLISIIIQVISTAWNLLPSVKNTLVSNNNYPVQLDNICDTSFKTGINSTPQPGQVFSKNEVNASEFHKLVEDLSAPANDATESITIEENDVKDHDNDGDGGNLVPGTYEVLQLEKEEILAPHTHFCTICGKGFKRDANLRMHMRGHGDEYKTPAALAKPAKDANSDPVPKKRYSCPFVGCKRNKEHKKFQPLKTILCVRNHYKRSHCDKSYTCSRCNTKKFSVLADLKTHEKHCGQDKWLCSCGTTFSRKDKLFGHVALFQGHTPSLPNDDAKVGAGPSDQGKTSEVVTGVRSSGFKFSDNNNNSKDDASLVDIKALEDDRVLFSAMNFYTCSFGMLDEFQHPAFDIPESSFTFSDVQRDL